MRLLAITTIALFQFITLHGQISVDGTPFAPLQSNLKSASTTSEVKLKKLNIQELNNYDKQNNIDNRYAVITEKKINIKKEGDRFEVSDGNVWIYKISSENAYSLSLIFADFKVPEGASLFVYNNDLSMVYGSFTSLNNAPVFAVAEFPGTEVIVEYYEPYDATFSGNVVLDKIGQSYKDILSFELKNGRDQHININCAEANGHQQEKYAVARMTYQVDGSGFLCSGSLINNSKNDGTPYFLTANHCISTEEGANSLVTYFNYEAVSCENNTLTNFQTLSGSELIATSQDTDVTLLLLNTEPPVNYLPYYAGYNYEDSDSVFTATGIHHPGGQSKKISLEYDTIYSYPFEISWEGNSRSPENSHWIVNFDDGFTEGGSSGSPLFDSNKKIIGQLHGGNEIYDFYGKFSESWVILQPFLDPDNITNGTLEGYFLPNSPPVASFYTSFSEICTDAPVYINSEPLFAPDNWKWSISPNTITFLEGTADTTDNPIISFNEQGIYTIELEVTNASGSDILSKTNYFNAGEQLNLEIVSSLNNPICAGKFETLNLKGNGAQNYTWEIIDTNSLLNFNTSDLLSAMVDITKQSGSYIDSSSSFYVQLIGEHGICSDTTTKNFTFTSPNNDFIQDAILLDMGIYRGFSNECATKQENEPYPDDGDCESQIAWCQCDITDGLIDNSVWFKFIAPETGIVGINAPGFDNQIALYEADDYTDIISGDNSRYSIIAANDDYFGPDKDYSALIEEATITPGKMYWLQVDGSACGDYGEFSVELYPNKITGSDFTSNPLSQPANNSLLVFPNPARNEFTVTMDNNDEFLKSLVLYSIQGQKIFEVDEINTSSYTTIIPQEIPNGMYILITRSNKKLYTNTLTVK